MKYLRLDRTERKALMDGLERMADFVAARCRRLCRKEPV